MGRRGYPRENSSTYHRSGGLNNMSKHTNETLSEISEKLDMLIALMKISNQDAIKLYRQQISKDNVCSRIMEKLEEPLTYGVLSKQVAEELAVAEITVKKKISDLKDAGLLKTVRKGREVLYEKSGLVD
jgi:DNA-binding transcriptional ArsR family regulator